MGVNNLKLDEGMHSLPRTLTKSSIIHATIRQLGNKFRDKIYSLLCKTPNR